MTLARDYLRTGELTLAQIASRTGYASPNAFSAAFRRRHGQPPGQWRQRELAAVEDHVGRASDDQCKIRRGEPGEERVRAQQRLKCLRH